MRYFIILMVALFGFSSVLYAFEEPLSDAYQEQRAKDIFKGLKCEVCAGQSVLDSESDFAKSVRALVRQRVSQGATDEQIYDLLKANFGKDIMFKPPFETETALLWLLPFVLIFGGFIVVIFVLRRSKGENAV